MASALGGARAQAVLSSGAGLSAREQGHDEPEVESLPAEHIESPPVQLDDESQRKLIRQLFNEYWAGIEDKPPTFAERLAIAERYINEKLADRDVGWRLDAATRKQLGLPSSPTVG